MKQVRIKTLINELHNPSAHCRHLTGWCIGFPYQVVAKAARWRASELMKCHISYHTGNHSDVADVNNRSDYRLAILNERSENDVVLKTNMKSLSNPAVLAIFCTGLIALLAIGITGCCVLQRQQMYYDNWLWTETSTLFFLQINDTIPITMKQNDLSVELIISYQPIMNWLLKTTYFMVTLYYSTCSYTEIN